MQHNAAMGTLHTTIWLNWVRTLDANDYLVFTLRRVITGLIGGVHMWAVLLHGGSGVFLARAILLSLNW